MIIGLTGGIASGKSTISAYFLEKGIPVIDADKIAREVVEPGEKTLEKLVTAFGQEILEVDGTIARKKLGEIIFNDETERLKLNSIIHPAIRTRMVEKKEELLQKGHSHIVYDIPLLFESNLTHMVEKVILAYVDEQVQLERLQLRDNSSKEEALRRIHSQMPLKDKVVLADEVINNNGSIEETKEQVLRILKKWNVL
ncbi:dephospho-CoA kinase [Bacillus alkalicellulosilyticus]|uniref:dephospho-CoA kinase n=1 Tax=Alkalihalobacterium alkalicellulosilyticum TaxID=1912214 RepID=UPI00099870FB|nr:dephospho-CoA kinase [Bacillus alkalicellulosilyticus]